jgi:hypothetical protein
VCAIGRVVTNDPAWARASAGWSVYEDDGLRELAFWIGELFDQRLAKVRQRQHGCVPRTLREGSLPGSDSQATLTAAAHHARMRRCAHRAPPTRGKGKFPPVSP